MTLHEVYLKNYREAYEAHIRAYNHYPPSFSLRSEADKNLAEADNLLYQLNTKKKV